MSRGKRYNGEQKLNMKKVFGVIAVFILIILFIFGIQKILKADKNTLATKNVELNYFTLFTNGNWGVINSSGEKIIEPAYGEMVVIPNKAKPVFICTYEVNYVDGTYKTKAINDKNQEIFTQYENISVIQNYDEDNNLWIEQKLLKVQNNGKYGLINLDGTEILPCEYDSITPLKGIENSIIIKKEGNVGLVNSEGKMIIPVEYSDITALTDDYQNGYIVKNAQSKFGIVASNGEKVLECKFDNIKHIVDSNMYVVQVAGTWKVILQDETSYLDGKVSNAVSIKNGNIIINENGKYGVLNIQAESNIPVQYEYLAFAFDDNYIAKKEGKYGIINSNNETVVDFKYNNIEYNKVTDYLKASNDNNTFDYLTRDLTVKLTAVNEEVLNGFIKIGTNATAKYYNFKLEEKTNKDVFTSNTLFTYSNNGKFGYVSKDGKTVIDAIYDDATEQNDYGYVAVKKDGKWGVIDQYGKIVVEPTYTLSNNNVIDFIGKWHVCADKNANYYTDMQE